MFRSAEQIYAGLMADQTLVELLGTYRFDNGTTTPAIVVLDANQTIPGLDLITGLEIILSKVPESSTTPDLTGGYTRSSIWRATLIEYPDGFPGAAQTAADRITSLVPGSNYSVLGGEILAGDSQIAVSIPAYASFLDIPLGEPQPETGVAAPTNITLEQRDGDSLQIASSTGTDATLGRASATLAGLLASEDALKLDAIAGGASTFEVEGASAVGDGAQASGINGSAFGSFATSYADGVTVVDGDVGAVLLGPCLEILVSRDAVYEDIGATITSLAAVPITFTLPGSTPVSTPAFSGAAEFPRGTSITIIQGDVGVVTVAAGPGVTLLGDLLSTAGVGTELQLHFDGVTWRSRSTGGLSEGAVVTLIGQSLIDGGNF